MARSLRLECLVVGFLLPFLPIDICAGHPTFYIKPTPSTPCPDPADPCVTLSEYAQQLPNSNYNTTLLLLPGNHVLSVDFTVENVSVFEILCFACAGGQATRIVCKGMVGFSLRSISQVTMRGLVVNFCGKDAVTTIYGVLFHSVLDGRITNCSFQDSIGTALRVINSSLDLRRSNSFTRNGRRCRNYMCSHLGGGIYANTSTLKFTGNSSFRVNSAGEGGGIAADYSVLDFTGKITFKHNLAKYGGGISAWTSTINFSGSSTFGENSAAHYGGGIEARSSTLNFTGGSTFANNSAARYGGGIAALHSTLMNFSGKSIFMNNSADFGGGIDAQSSTTLNFSGGSTFRNNSASYGGGICAGPNTLLNFNGNSTFKNNYAAVAGGGIVIFHHNILNFTGDINFTHNLALAGGGMSVMYSTMISTGNCLFTNNSAIGYGGGMYVLYSTLYLIGNGVFGNNLARVGGGIYATVSTLSVGGNSSDIIGKHSRGGTLCTSLFVKNSALIHGGAVYTEDSFLTFQGHSIFSRNSANYSAGGIYSKNTTLRFNGSTSFSSNSGQLLGGGVYGLGTLLYFTGNSSFTANTATRGGGEYLVNSFNILSQNASVTMDGNNATEYGGGVYVEDSDPISYCFPNIVNLESCLFQVDGLLQTSVDQLVPIFFDPAVILQSNEFHAIRAFLNVSIHFSSNHAQKAGSAVYGGSVDSCAIDLVYNTTSVQGIARFNWQVPNLELEPNSISSDPFQVCLCKDGVLNCNTPELDRQMQVYPGQLLKLSVVATGQRDGTVPAVVRAFFHGTDKYASVPQFQDTQNVSNICTELYYEVHSSATNNSATLVLYADGPCSTNGKLLHISLKFHDCPHGFSLNPSEGICECEPRLQKYTTRCNITKRTLERNGEFWVGYDNISEGLILHPHCPFDYCASGHVKFTLNDTDKQCDNNRSGLLCGECKSGYSLALGSSKCLLCSNIYILLIIPFALAGIALVLLLLICKLTVATGTINGLIFYANIVAVNRSIFFPANEANILTVFIAWVNLDLGVETCFFHGMDAYLKTWLQFVFPLYVWSLVGLMIMASRYSPRITRVFGSNPVAVLATLFLLSYAKLFRAIIAALCFTFLDYPDEVRVVVWLYDGNILYIHSKHIALFLAALLAFLLFFLPYTILLTVGQCLRANSNRRFFRWINSPRINPFLDAYYAPYRDQHRYWTGLMLCLRCVLYPVLVLLSLVSADPSHNLLAIQAAVIALLTLIHFTGLIYHKLYLDVLEASFILNLGILAAATYSVRLAEIQESQAAVTYVSVGIAFVTFVGVLVYHMYQRVWPKLQQITHQLRHNKEHQSENFDEAVTDNQPQITSAPTMTIVECPSPKQLISTDSDSSKSQTVITPINFIELREPLNLIDTSDH